MTIKAALIQHLCTEDIEQNLQKTIQGIREAKVKGAELAVLQELHRSTYFCHSEDPKYFDLAETIPGNSTEIFGQLAKELQIVLVLSLFEKRAKGLFHNTAVVLEKDGTIAGKYRKMHIPDDPGFYEKFYFTPGDLGFQPIQTSVGRLGVLVCWDQWYPEAARLMALKGADVLIYPTAIGWDKDDSEDEKQRQLNAWITIQRSHAIANGIPVLSVNRVGFEAGALHPGTLFWGNSFACGPQGEVLIQASSDSEENLLCELDFNRTETVRRIWPFFRDRRIDFYKDLNQRFLD